MLRFPSQTARTQPLRREIEGDGVAPGAGLPQDLVAASAASIALLSDHDLLKGWAATSIRLHRIQQLEHPGPALADVAQERAQYLVELERRYPALLQA